MVLIRFRKTKFKTKFKTKSQDQNQDQDRELPTLIEQLQVTVTAQKPRVAKLFKSLALVLVTVVAMVLVVADIYWTRA